MKIGIQAPMKGQEIQSLLENLEKDGIQFSFVEKRGLNLIFEVQGADAETAISMAKQEIKATDWGKVLYLSIQAM